MYWVTVEDGLNKNSKSHLSLADAPIFKSAKEMMAKPEIMVAYTSDLKKLAFDKQKMPSIEKAISTVESIKLQQVIRALIMPESHPIIS